MNFINYLILFVLSYLFGSFPSAYLLIKWTEKKDIRKQGSGNVGALNALRISKSKTIGFIVLVLDLLKGLVPAYFFTRIVESEYLFLLILVSGVLLGHVYPVWLKFKGGRGLAVTAGALLVLKPVLVLIWLVVWAIFFIMIKKHIIASLVATFTIPLIVFFTRGIYFSNDIFLVILPVFMLIFQRYLERIPDLVEQKRLSIKNGE